MKLVMASGARIKGMTSSGLDGLKGLRVAGFAVDNIRQGISFISC